MQKYSRKRKKQWRRMLRTGDTSYCPRCGSCGCLGCCDYYCDVCAPFNARWYDDGEAINVDKETGE